MTTIKDTLKEMMTNNPKGWFSWLRKQQQILDEIERQGYPSDLPLVQKVYWFINGLMDFPKCNCGKSIKKFRNTRLGYFEHCCCSCAQLDKETKKKLAETNLKRFGAVNAAQSKIIQDKMKATCLKKYGAENIFGSEIGKQKIKETNLERFGCENPTQNSEIRSRSKQTMINRYGITCGFHNGKIPKRSKGEIELYEFIQANFSDARHSDHKQIWPLELDIFIPSLNIGIEYDGSYWHSLPDMIERDKKKDEICKEKGIFLIRIQEKNWLSKTAEEKTKIMEILNGHKRS